MSRKKWSPSQKFEIALLAIKGETTLNEICTRYAVSPTQVHAWKKQLIDQGSQLFEKNNKTKTETTEKTEREQSKLYEKIGQLTVERDFLKKVWGKFHGSNDEN